MRISGKPSKRLKIFQFHLFFENPLNQVRLFVVVRAEDNVEADVLEGHELLVLVLLDARRVEDGSVVLADAEVGPLVLILRENCQLRTRNLLLLRSRVSHQFGHVVVELELEVLLLVGLEEADVDLLGDNLRADVVLDGEAEPHLLQDQLHLLPPLHRSAGLNL